MFKSQALPSISKFRSAPIAIVGFCLSFAVLIFVPPAWGQDFTIQANQFNPSKINQGGTSSLNVSVVTTTGFSGTIDFTCEVTSQQSSDIPPDCQMSPTSMTASGGAIATITSTGTSTGTTPGLYTVTVTATGSSGPPLTLQRELSVLAVAAQFTITVTTAVQPSSVHAGYGGEGVISVNPINGYSGVVTLSCTSVSPLVTIPPICSFSNEQPVTVGNGFPGTSTISITTFGPVPTVSVAHQRSFYALWLPLPMLAFIGLGAAAGGKRSRKALGLLALFVVSGCLLLMPACGNNTSSVTTTPNGTTPKNTYTFTVTGIDANGNSSSNTGSGSGSPSVTLTVD